MKSQSLSTIIDFISDIKSTRLKFNFKRNGNESQLSN